MTVEDELMRWQRGSHTFDRWDDGLCHAVKGEFIDVFSEALCESTGAVRFTWGSDYPEEIDCPACRAIMGMGNDAGESNQAETIGRYIQVRVNERKTIFVDDLTEEIAHIFTISVAAAAAAIETETKQKLLQIGLSISGGPVLYATDKSRAERGRRCALCDQTTRGRHNRIEFLMDWTDDFGVEHHRDEIDSVFLCLHCIRAVARSTQG